MPSYHLVHHLTGEYFLNHHLASQSVPLYASITMDGYGKIGPTSGTGARR